MKRVCVVCARIIELGEGPRCAEHKLRNRPRGNAFEPTRQRILKRDGYRCTHLDNGQGCPVTTNLHVDHIVPLSHGGSDADSNLRVLCAMHNLGRPR